MSNKIAFNEKIYWDILENKIVGLKSNTKLTKSELRTLEILVSKIDKPVQMSEIYEYIFWNDDREYNPKTIRNIISKLRQKLETSIIENIYGCSYIIK